MHLVLKNISGLVSVFAWVKYAVFAVFVNLKHK
jgi:hypothetical protein